MADVDDAFRPPGEPWVAVSEQLITARRISLALTWIVVVAGVVALYLFAAVPRTIAIAATIVAVIAFVWLWILIGRRVRSWGYAEREDDVLVTSGLLFRRLVVVPYGRMQLVDLKAGPLDRALGITTLQLHTAAATTDASIPGLTPDIAAGLRDRLAALGEQRSAGL